MKEKKNPVILVVGCMLLAMALYLFFNRNTIAGITCLGYGGALFYRGFSSSRRSFLVFGHVCIALGCLLATWGIYLLPHSEPTLAHIFGRPLFWGLFSIFGGICANYHGFCKCIRSGSSS